jgi:hypothetical protein
VATITGQRASSTLPGCDTPRDAGTFPAHGDPADSAQSARSAWRSVTPSIAGTPHVRISRDGGRTFPGRHARPLPAEAPGQPCTVPVYDAGSASGWLLVLDLDSARGDVDRQAAGLGQLLAASIMTTDQAAIRCPSGGTSRPRASFTLAVRSHLGSRRFLIAAGWLAVRDYDLVVG